MSAITSHTPWAEPVTETFFGIYDMDSGDFTERAYVSWQDAEDRADELELIEHDHGSRAWFPKYWPRYSVDVLPADHPLIEQVRA